MNKRNIIIVLILIEAITLFLTIKSYSNKVVKSNNNTSLAEVHRKQFSIYTNTTGSYTEWSNNTFPTEGYNLNLTESYCEDNNGTRVSNILSYSNDKVTVTSNKTLFCTLYFDVLPPEPDIVVNNPVSVLQNNYNVNASCDNGTATWDKMHSRLMFDTVTSVTDTCTLSAGSTPTNLGRLIDIVEDSTKLVSVGDTGVVHETFASSANSSITVDAGYRYEGSEPNNYIWFNDEMWRIIGSIPTKVDVTSGGVTTQEIQNRIKIIRNDSIGGLARTSGSSRAWTTYTPLYMLLNGCYYGKRNMSDSYRNPDTGVDSGTSCSNYCIGYQTSQKSHCNYSENGINPSGRYANMIENVYWNIGASTYSATASVIYENETAAQTIKGRIGLMSASDYGFATSQSHGLALNSSSGTDYTNKYTNDWLYKGGFEGTITPYTSGNRALFVPYNGYVSYNSANNGIAVRPVLYLSPSVYVVSGDGSIQSPYQIAMN